VPNFVLGEDSHIRYALPMASPATAHRNLQSTNFNASDTKESLQLIPDDSRSANLQAALGIALLAVAILNVGFQVVWFWRFSAHNINADAVSYIGIARHLADGNLHASLHGYWSPLISWCIAASSIFTHDFVLLGHIVSIGSFLICLPLLYLLTFRLWQSRLLAAISVLCFTLSRGVIAFSVSFIGADFLLTGAVLCYFLLLLRCLETSKRGRWFLLGTAHALAFLAKAFAMPWLALSTIAAAVASGKRNPRAIATSMIWGLAIPILVWSSWGLILGTKYGRFTAGYQSKWNLLDTETKRSMGSTGLLFLRDMSHSIDGYMVGDSMYPGSDLWNAHIRISRTVRQAFRNELHNLPEAVKQIAILLTPGGVLAFVWCLFSKRKKQCPSKKQLAWLIMFNSITLVFGYCMLVFDSRYVLPLVPVWIAFAVRFLFPDKRIHGSSSPHSVPLILYTGSIFFFLIYWASPFRTMQRDYQTSIYAAAMDLQGMAACNRLIVIGKGPFPEHGVGWEAGLYASFFAGCRVVAFNEDLPTESSIQSALADVNQIQPNAILVLGPPQSRQLTGLVGRLMDAQIAHHSASLSDGRVGKIGELLWK